MWYPFHRFTDQRARNAAPGRHVAGRGLWFCRAKDGTATWELCVRIHGKSRDIELGDYPEMSVKAARKEASLWRGLARSGLDPSTEQEGIRDAAARNLDQFYC